jgi:hypothetical protein
MPRLTHLHLGDGDYFQDSGLEDRLFLDNSRNLRQLTYLGLGSAPELVSDLGLCHLTNLTELILGTSEMISKECIAGLTKLKGLSSFGGLLRLPNVYDWVQKVDYDFAPENLDYLGYLVSRSHRTPESGAAYNKANNQLLHPCYACDYLQSRCNYWDEIFDRYRHRYRHFNPQRDSKSKGKIRKLLNQAVMEWKTAEIEKPERFAGGTGYAKSCAFEELPFVEKEARALDVEANIKDLPDGECYPCIYQRWRAHFMSIRFRIQDQIEKNYYKKLDEDGGIDSDEEDDSDEVE